MSHSIGVGSSLALRFPEHEAHNQLISIAWSFGALHNFFFFFFDSTEIYILLKQRVTKHSSYKVNKQPKGKHNLGKVAADYSKKEREKEPRELGLGLGFCPFCFLSFQFFFLILLRKFLPFWANWAYGPLDFQMGQLILS